MSNNTKHSIFDSVGHVQLDRTNHEANNWEVPFASCCGAARAQPWAEPWAKGQVMQSMYLSTHSSSPSKKQLVMETKANQPESHLDQCVGIPSSTRTRPACRCILNDFKIHFIPRRPAVSHADGYRCLSHLIYFKYIYIILYHKMMFISK